ncbi:MAG: hypothetical protein K2L45_12255 [Muribaculaceae bacterium]|nr:hypothetical protein [Muribaculaceae bacterium]
MELIVEKTKEGRVLLRYQDGNFRTRWIDAEYLLKIASDELDFDMMSDDIHNAVVSYIDVLKDSDKNKVDFITSFFDIINLMNAAKQLRSLDAEDRNNHTGFVGETTEIFRCEC